MLRLKIQNPVTFTKCRLPADEPALALASAALPALRTLCLWHHDLPACAVAAVAQAPWASQLTALTLFDSEAFWPPHSLEDAAAADAALAAALLVSLRQLQLPPWLPRSRRALAPAASPYCEEPPELTHPDMWAFVPENAWRLPDLLSRGFQW